MANDPTALFNLVGLLAGLILIGVVRRVFDTRAYGTILVALGRALAARANGHPLSTTNARLGMGRELADFLEQQIPDLLRSFVQLAVALLILWSFHPALFASAIGTGILVVLIYATAHQRFFRLNGDINQQMEKQVAILSTNVPKKVWIHLARLRKTEVRISDNRSCCLRHDFHRSSRIHRFQFVVRNRKHRYHRGPTILARQLLVGLRGLSAHFSGNIARLVAPVGNHAAN